jgi:hypothetical protein
MNKTIGLSMGVAALGVTGAGVVSGEMALAVASVVLGVGALWSALRVRKQVMMGKIDINTLYTLR